MNPWTERALSGDAVWQHGQLTQTDAHALNKLVAIGQLVRERARWAHISPLKTVWFLPGCEPQEVMAERWHRQHRKAPTHG